MMLMLYTHPDFEESADNFYKHYDLVDFITPGQNIYSKRAVKHTNPKICLFCGKSSPDTKFSNHSHLVSQLIGNTDLYSSFECDLCNKLFSKLENDLANYLGIGRSLTGINGSALSPGFWSKNMRAKSRVFENENILIIDPNEISKEGNTTTITYTKNSFRLLNVYKSFLKFGLSTLDPNETNESYQIALKILTGQVRAKGLEMTGYVFNPSLNIPLHIYIFRKRSKNNDIPTHIINFYFQNHAIALPLPLHKDDIRFLRIEHTVITPPPYLMNQTVLTQLNPQFFRRDFSSDDLVSNEEEILHLAIDPSTMGNLSVYNPDTDSFDKGDYKTIQPQYLIFTKNGVLVDPKAMSNFISQEIEKKK